MTVKKYRKLPIVIEAIQLTPENFPDVMQFTKEIGTERHVRMDQGKPKALGFFTFEGVTVAELGDWIIRGVKGEFYPCKPDIFAVTYEEADDHA